MIDSDLIGSSDSVLVASGSELSAEATKGDEAPPERPWPRTTPQVGADGKAECPFHLTMCDPGCVHAYGQRPPPAYKLLERWGIESPARNLGEDNTYIALPHALKWATGVLESQGVEIPKLRYPRWEGRRFVE